MAPLLHRLDLPLDVGLVQTFLLRSPNWSVALLPQSLWQSAESRVTELKATREDVLVWDERVVEYPESVRLSDVRAVRSSKAQCFKRIKPNFFNPPGGPRGGTAERELYRDSRRGILGVLVAHATEPHDMR